MVELDLKYQKLWDYVKGLVNIEVREVLEAKRWPFTPIDIGSGVTIITGANMGGKVLH